MSMRVAALNVTQSDDFDIVLNLISQLGHVLEENRVVTNELISVADTLETDDDDETDSESVSLVCHELEQCVNNIKRSRTQLL